MRSFPERFRQIHGKARPVLGTCLYGLVASLAAVVFQVAINWIYQRCYKSPAAGTFVHFAWISLAVIVTTSLLAGWLLNSFCPEAAGSGIPQVKLAFWKEFGYAPRRIAWIKFLAGAISIGGEHRAWDEKGQRCRSAGTWRRVSRGYWGFRNRIAAQPARRARRQGLQLRSTPPSPQLHSCWRKSSAI